VAILTGTVSTFDEAAGLGSIDGDDGVAYPFHCIEISDGTRTIEAGRRVAFSSSPRFGRAEAGDVTKL
jgi:cold shock CspA family protein